MRVIKNRTVSLLIGLSYISQNIYGSPADITWKDLKSQFRWTTTNVLWCRYKTPSGHLFENAGRQANPKEIMTYIYSKQDRNYFWSCPDVNDPLHNRHACPHLLTAGQYNYSNSWFVVNDQSNQALRTQFEQDAQTSCTQYTPHHDYAFVEYGVKSTADFLSTLFHRPLYSKAPDLGKNLPFSRLVVFGDSLTDTGNSFSTLSYPKWPYFIGRFSNGPIWVEYINESLMQSENSTFDLYNYAVGGGGVTNPSYNPFGIFYKQVRNYLDVMREGEKNKVLDPGYESTLFVIFVGSNDYMVLTQHEGLLEKLLYCSPNEPKECAQLVVKGIKTEIETILKSTKNKAKYFLVPIQPDITLAPYYQKLTGDELKDKKFIAEAIKAHNIYLAAALDQIEKKHPHIQILRLDLNQAIADMVNNPHNVMNSESGITNTKDACFSGSAKNIENQTFCTDPASYMFWDGIHLTTTTNCDLGEYAVSEIYKTFGRENSENPVYNPRYARCHLNDITHASP